MQNYLYGSVISIKYENCPFQAGRRKRVNHEQEMIQLNTIDTSSSNARCVDATPLLLYRGRRAIELQVALPWAPTEATREHFWSYHFVA